VVLRKQKGSDVAFAVSQVLHEGTRVEGPKDKLLLDIEEVAALTGFSVGTLYHWVSQRRIPVVRISSRCVRFRRSDIDSWLQEKFVAPMNDITR
jgi:excisionase family DNA binding protein